MVRVNKEKREITIITDGDSSDVVQMQRALINLMQCYNFTDYGNGAGETFYFGLSLLESLLPDYDQQHRGFTSEADYLELPENMNPQQRQSLKDALFTIRTGTKVRAEKNNVLKALQSISV